MKEKKERGKKEHFMTGVKAESSRITWPGQKEIGKQFLVVLLVSVLAALLITGVDTLIQAGIELLISL